MRVPAILTEYQQQALTRIVEKIVKAVEPETIICFGVQVISRTNWSCFALPAKQVIEDHLRFDLLLLTGDKNRRKQDDIMNIVRQQGEINIELNCVVHKWEIAYKIWREGDAFFSTMFNQGLGVYRSNPDRLVIIPPEYHLTANTIFSDWNRFFPLAQNFLIAAEHSISREFPAVTVFLLHQAVEQTCQALIRICTGHRKNSHNLAHLLSFVSNFFVPIERIFPNNTIEEKELFEILLRGYGDPRYRDHYTVDLDKLPILMRRVKDMQSMAEAFFRLKFGSKNSALTLSNAG